jgi:hypothetical protein
MQNDTKPPKDFNGPALLDLLKRFLEIYERNSQEATRASEKAAKQSSQKLQHAFAGLAISILIAASGFFLTKYFEENRRKQEDVQAEIERKLKKLDDISAALTDVRKVKDDVLIDCGTKFYNERDIEHKRLDARANLVKIIRNSGFYFSEEVHKKVISFIKWESAFKDYCSKDLPNDLVWRAKHREIDTLMRDSFPKKTFIHESDR